MKSLYFGLFALFILFSTESKAQNYIPFPDSNAMWTNTWSTYEWAGQQLTTPMLLGVDYYCMGTQDTLINSISYNKVNQCGLDYHGAMRDNGGQVFYVPKDSISEMLLYDFTKSVGDTIFDVYFFGSPGWINDFIVENIDSMLIGSNYHKRVLLEDMSGEWIEGIGNNFGLFIDPYTNLSGTVLELKCMSSSNVTLYPFYGNGTCPMNVDLDEIDFTEEFQISPNPTTGSISISSEENLFSYELCDITGKVLLVSNEKVAVANLDLTLQESGIYILRVRIGDHLKSLRIVKK